MSVSAKISKLYVCLQSEMCMCPVVWNMLMLVMALMTRYMYWDRIGGLIVRYSDRDEYKACMCW